MSKYDCEIIKDLIPLYIDNVCSGKTASKVEEHFTECPECKALYESMKEDIVSSKTDISSDSEEAKRIMTKVNTRINTVNKKVKYICITICCILLAVALLFLLPIKRIPKKNIAVSLTEVPIILSEDRVGVEYDEPGWVNNVLYIKPDEKGLDECKYTRGIVPGYDDFDFAIATDFIEENEDLSMSVITVSSDYTIKNISQEYVIENGRLKFNLTKAFTTLIGKQYAGARSEIVFYHLGNVDELDVYAK